jgi:hypothetical protein
MAVRGRSVLGTVLAVAFAAAAVALSSSGAAGSGFASSCPKPLQAAALGGCLVDAWPTDPSKYSTIVAKAAGKCDSGELRGLY